MSFFTYFPRVEYRFGNEQNPDVFRNISVYADIIDQIKDNIAFYYDYTIEEFERADQLSYKLYGTTDYHWTFYLLNDNIRERGWPLNNRELMDKVKKQYPHTTLTTKTPLTNRFRLGQTVTGNSSAAEGLITHRNLDLGQLTVKNVSGTFTAGETLTSLTIVDRPTLPINTAETIILESSELQYLAAHHYEDADKKYVDIDPSVGPGALLTEVTNLDRFVRFNDELKEIRIIKPDSINQVVRAFREAIRN